MSKSITVRYFALFRENAGIDEEQVCSDAKTAGDLFAELIDRHGSSGGRRLRGLGMANHFQFDVRYVRRGSGRVQRRIQAPQA